MMPGRKRGLVGCRLALGQRDTLRGCRLLLVFGGLCLCSAGFLPAWVLQCTARGSWSSLPSSSPGVLLHVVSWLPATHWEPWLCLRWQTPGLPRIQGGRARKGGPAVPDQGVAAPPRFPRPLEWCSRCPRQGSPEAVQWLAGLAWELSVKLSALPGLTLFLALATPCWGRNQTWPQSFVAFWVGWL